MIGEIWAHWGFVGKVFARLADGSLCNVFGTATRSGAEISAAALTAVTCWRRRTGFSRTREFARYEKHVLCLRQARGRSAKFALRSLSFHANNLLEARRAAAPACLSAQPPRARIAHFAMYLGSSSPGSL